MVAFIRAPTAASAVPAALAVASLASSPPSSSSHPPNHRLHHHPFPRLSFPVSFPFGRNRQSFKAFASPSLPQAAVEMDSRLPELRPSNQLQKEGMLPELLTEFMVDMKCDGCVSVVKDKLLKLDGIKGVDVDLNNQVVRVVGSLPVKTMIDALEQTGRKARLIGQGSSEDFLISAAVAEFKGPVIYGVVRLAQVNMELARIEASFSGLSPGKHGWAINEFGDLTKGAESTGKIFSPLNQITSAEPIGDLGTLEVQENGEAHFSGAKQLLRVADLIGRSVVVYETADKSDSGIAAAVLARSAGVGENYKKICTCDGVTIWESTQNF